MGTMCMIKRTMSLIKQKKSRARIVNDLVLEKFDKEITKVAENTVEL